MSLATFKLEEYLARYEFSAPYLLCCSDAQSFSLTEILGLASPAEKQLWERLHLGYTQAQGAPVLREAIARNLYPGLTADDVLCFAGAEEGIFCGLHAMLSSGDHAVVLTPCYQSLLEVPKSKGASITEVMLREEQGWRIDAQAVKGAIRSNTKCIVINFPHNPTGQVIEEEDLKSLVEICERHDLWLFCDEVYRLLGKPDKPWASPAASLSKKALSLGVMSKAFGLAGLRVGWIACSDREILKRIEQVKHYTSICNSAPSEVLSLIALNQKEAILGRNNQVVAENLALLDAFFAEYNDQFAWVRPQGGCVGFVKYLRREPVDDFCDRLVREKGVLLMPGSIYDHFGNHFRIGFGRTNMPEALSRLREFLQS